MSKMTRNVVKYINLRTRPNLAEAIDKVSNVLTTNRKVVGRSLAEPPTKNESVITSIRRAIYEMDDLGLSPVEISSALSMIVPHEVQEILESQKTEDCEDEDAIVV